MEKTLRALLQGAVATFGPKAALRWKEEGRWGGLTYSELGTTVEEVGRALLALGVSVGDRIAIFSPNRYEWMVVDLAVVSIGAVSVPIYATNSAETTRYILLHSEAKMIFIGSLACMTTFSKIHSEVPGLRVTILFDEPPASLDLNEPILFSDFKKKSQLVIPEAFAARATKIRSEDLSTLIYTSGTTGEPKGVMLSHANIVSDAEDTLKPFSVNQDDSTLSFLPLSHAFERTVGLYLMLHVGATINIAEDISKIADNLLETSPTVMITVPRLLEKFRAKVIDKMEKRSLAIRLLFKWAFGPSRQFLSPLFEILFYKKIRNAMGGKLRMIDSGGAALSPDVANFFQTVGIPVIQGYGLTETSPVASANILSKNKIGTVGPAIPEVEIRIASDGEVLIRGPNVMMGYYKNPEATREAIDQEGWFHTGDIGELDADRYLKITDRKKELIVTSGGKKVAPQPMENELKLDPLIEQICILGDGKNYLAALIVPNFATLESKVKGLSRDQILNNPTIKQLYDEAIKKFNEKYARYESIKRFKLLPNDWTIEGGEITPTLKLRRRIIQKKYASEIQSLFS